MHIYGSNGQSNVNFIICFLCFGLVFFLVFFFFFLNITLLIYSNKHGTVHPFLQRTVGVLRIGAGDGVLSFSVAHPILCS